VIELPPAARRAHIVALALLLGAVPTGTCAAPPAGKAPPAGIVRVTAGEHGDFSRVVFALGADLEYRTEDEPDGFRIVFPDALVGFEYDEVYPRRRARRVIMAEPALSGDGASLRLGFGCDCAARTFVLGDKLVVDVFDAASSASHVDRPDSDRSDPGDSGLERSAGASPARRADAATGASGTGGGVASGGPLALAQDTAAHASADELPRPGSCAGSKA
jgi:hypothetical protein